LRIKKLKLKNFKDFYATDSETNTTEDSQKDVKIEPLTTDDIFKDGITIAVTFTKE
jgi:hypothetical protein